MCVRVRVRVRVRVCVCVCERSQYLSSTGKVFYGYSGPPSMLESMMGMLSGFGAPARK